MVYKKGSRHQKRWYVNAGANLPFIGKTNFAAGSGKHKRSLAAAVTSIVRKDLETPHHFINSEASQVLNSSTFYTQNVLSTIPQGTANNQRIGDEIHIDAIKVKGYFYNNSNFANNMVGKIMLVKSREQFGTTTGSFVSGLGSSTLLLNSPSDITMSALYDPKLFTKVWEHNVNLKPTTASQGIICPLEHTIKIDNKFIYETGKTVSKTMNYYFVASANMYGQGVGSTIGGVVLTTDVIFKNSK